MNPLSRTSRTKPETTPPVLRDDRSLASIGGPAPDGWLSRWCSRLSGHRGGCRVCGRSLARCAYDGRHPEIGR